MRISSISNQNMYRSYQQMSSGKKINTAADDAAGLAIAQKLLSQSNSLNKATDNAATFQDMTKIADGALGSISDSLQRIRELGLQASNGLYTDINSTIDALGLADFDVTKDFSLDTIDNAIEMVSTSRGEMGALSNRLDYAMNNNSYTAFNTTASQSRIEDLDFGKAVTEQKKKEVLFQYSIMMQRKKMEDENGRMNQLFTRL